MPVATTAPAVVVAVLAAGRSSRMPAAHKLLLPFPAEPSTVLGHSVRTAVEAAVGRVAVVLPTGADGEALEGAISGLDIERLPNPRAREGLSTSVRTAIRWARGRAAALVLLLADEPGVSAESIVRLVAAWRRSDAPALRIRYADRPGHPVLLRLDAIRASGPEPTGDRGLASWLASDRIGFVQVDGEAPIDIDTPDDYRAALARLPQ